MKPLISTRDKPQGSLRVIGKIILR